MKRAFSLLSICVVMLASSWLLIAQSQETAKPLVERMQDQITTFTLDNGMTFIICERNSAPIVSFHTVADVGSVDEHRGISGMAHMFEHEAFKGNLAIGTTDYQAELLAMQATDKAFDALRLERQKGHLADPALLKKFESNFKHLQDKANEFVVAGEYDKILSKAGAVGSNAFTSPDSTEYFMSMPSNKVELWFALESERFLFPILREFYKERDVVKEERRMRTDNVPNSKLRENMVANAYRVHPYGSPPVGYNSDLDSFTRAEAMEFFDIYYTASNLTTVIVGNITAAHAKTLAEKYFGRLPKRPKPPRVESVEMPMLGVTRITHKTTDQPMLIMMWHAVDINHPDHQALTVFRDIVGSGPNSRLYKALVYEQKLATWVGMWGSNPGVKYPGLTTLFAANNVDVELNPLETAIDAILEDVKLNGVSQEEIDRVVNGSYATLVQDLKANHDLAKDLAYYQVKTGDWKNLFTQMDKLKAVSPTDIKRVANKYFNLDRRIIGTLETETQNTDNKKD